MLLAVVVVAVEARAQPPAPSGAAPSSSAGLLSYHSPLGAYRPFTEESVIPWRDANDTVARIGGWREYARESAPAGSSEGPAPAGTGKDASRQVPARPGTPSPTPPAPPAGPATPVGPAGHGAHQH